MDKLRVMLASTSRIPRIQKSLVNRSGLRLSDRKEGTKNASRACHVGGNLCS